jgi:hypothetical protein
LTYSEWDHEFRGPVPFAYGGFADLWNSTDHPCGFSLQDAAGFWVPERVLVPHDLFVDVYNDSLRKAKLILGDSSVNERLLSSWKIHTDISPEWQQRDQERIQRQHDIQYDEKQEGIGGARLVGHAAESQRALLQAQDDRNSQNGGVGF